MKTLLEMNESEQAGWIFLNEKFLFHRSFNIINFLEKIGNKFLSSSEIISFGQINEVSRSLKEEAKKKLFPINIEDFRASCHNSPF